MARILTRLAIGNFCLLLLAFSAGVLSWSEGGLRRPDQTSLYLIHFCLGLSAIIVNLGLHCLVFIYFLGTGRWVKEVAQAYQLPDEPLPKLTRELKRRTYPAALAAMLVPIATGAAGMATQTLPPEAARWTSLLHFSLAVIALLINLWACRVAYRDVCINSGVIDQVMTEVERIRAERGLPTSAQELAQQGESSVR